MNPQPRRETLKVLFLDISRTLTGEGSAGKREADPNAIQALAEYVRQNRIQKIAFVTALSGPGLFKGRENIWPYLEKHGLDRISELHCESGLYKWVNGAPVFSAEAQGFQKIMRDHQKTLDAVVSQSGLKASNVSLQRGKLAQVRYEFADETERTDKTKNKQLGKVITEAITRAGLGKNVDVIVTGSGINLQPRDMSKGVIAQRIIHGWQQQHTKHGQRPPRIVGKAIGDFAEEDSQMGIGKVKFRKVTNAGHARSLFEGLSLPTGTLRKMRGGRKEEFGDALRLAKIQQRKRQQARRLKRGK